MKKLLTLFLLVGLSFAGYGQCPAGQTEITIEIYPISFGSEVGWELVDITANTVVACRPSGTYVTGPGPVVEGPFCVTDGNTLEFTGYDSFGDDWNGGYFNVIITEDGSVNGCAAQDGCLLIERGGEDIDVEPDVNVASSCDAAEPEEFVITLPVFACDATPINGCTNPSDPNFDSCATIDDGSCVCLITQNEIADGATFAASDAAVIVTPVTAVTNNTVTAIQTLDGSFDGEHGLGLYQGTFDDGTVIGLPPAGTGLFGTDTETSIEGSTPGSNDINTAGNWGNPSAVGNSFSSAALVDGATYTLFIVDDFGDGWDGSDAELVDCEGNVIIASMAPFIDAIAADAQDELAWTTFVYNAPATTVNWTGTGAVTNDPDGTPNSGDETYSFDPAMAGADGCDPVDVTLTMETTACGTTCSTEVTVTVNPAPMMVAMECDGDPCTTGDMQSQAADGTECSCTPGTVDLASCDPACTTTNFNVECDGDPGTVNDTEIVAADGSQCSCIPGGVSPPVPAITCPPVTLNICDGDYDCMIMDNNPVTANNGVTDTPILTGTAAFATDNNGIIDVSQLTSGVTYTLTLNYEENGTLGVPVTCTFTADAPNPAEGGAF